MTLSRGGPNMVERAIFKGGKLRPILRCVLFLLVWPVVTLLLFEAVRGVGPAARDGGLTFTGVGAECAAAVCVALIFRWSLDGRFADSLGFTFRARWLRLFGLGVLLGAGMQTLVLAMENALGFAHADLTPWTSRELPALGQGAMLLLLAAVTEEISMRGYVLQNLMEEWGPPAAVVVTSLLFAALHLANPGASSDLLWTMLSIAGAGALFALSVLWTRSLWLALGCHFAWNLFEGPVFGLPVSGMSFGSPSVLTASVAGPVWFTGGSFGPEGGLSSIVALAAGTAVLYALHRCGAFAR